MIMLARPSHAVWSILLKDRAHHRQIRLVHDHQRLRIAIDLTSRSQQRGTLALNPARDNASVLRVIHRHRQACPLRQKDHNGWLTTMAGHDARSSPSLGPLPAKPTTAITPAAFPADRSARSGSVSRNFARFADKIFWSFGILDGRS